MTGARVLAATTAVLGILAGGAVAAPRPAPVCRLLTDPAGDTYVARPQEAVDRRGPVEETLDIVSADVATNATTVTGVVRPKRAAKSGATSPAGNGFAVEFFLPGSPMTMSLRALYTPAGDIYEVAYYDAAAPPSRSTVLGPATGTLDPARNEIRISAPLSLFASQGVRLGRGGQVLGLEAYSGRAFPPVPAVAGQPSPVRFVFADSALEGRPYTLGAPSCVPVGR